MNDFTNFTGKHFVITGASSGLGRATCVLLSQYGANISLIARNESKLNETLSKMNRGGAV